MPILDTVFLTAAGALAGLVGTAGAITSLVSYPALLVVGVPALSANIANLVAVVACWPGSALASRPELAGQANWLRHFGPVAAIGGATGAALLLSTPARLFADVVPFLVAAGSITLLLAPRLTARPHPRPHHDVSLAVALLAVSLYGGYFGAGSGVMVLALMLLRVNTDMPTANALKNMLVGAGVIVSAAAFVIFAPVQWSAVIPLGAGMFVGSIFGPRVTRRVPAEILRPIIALIGIGLAIQLWLSHGA
jgi:uncharacterized membrane protein YfcA